MLTYKRNITRHDSLITKRQRRDQNGHQSFIRWFTGLSVAGKSAITNVLAKALPLFFLPLITGIV